MLLRCSDVIYLIMWYCWYITTWGQIKHKQENIFTDVRFYRWKLKYNDTYDIYQQLLNLPNNVWRLIVFAPFLIIKSPKQRLETYCFCSISYYYFYYYYSYSFFPQSMNLSTADLRNYRIEFHETWWSYRYMFLVGPKALW